MLLGTVLKSSNATITFEFEQEVTEVVEANTLIGLNLIGIETVRRGEARPNEVTVNFDINTVGKY